MDESYTYERFGLSYGVAEVAACRLIGTHTSGRQDRLRENTFPYAIGNLLLVALEFDGELALCAAKHTTDVSNLCVNIYALLDYLRERIECSKHSEQAAMLDAVAKARLAIHTALACQPSDGIVRGILPFPAPDPELYRLSARFALKVMKSMPIIDPQLAASIGQSDGLDALISACEQIMQRKRRSTVQELLANLNRQHRFPKELLAPQGFYATMHHPYLSTISLAVSTVEQYAYYRSQYPLRAATHLRNCVTQEFQAFTRVLGSMLGRREGVTSGTRMQR